MRKVDREALTLALDRMRARPERVAQIADMLAERAWDEVARLHRTASGTTA
jgi:hypothetical protein